jgi:hypothetical protein
MSPNILMPIMIFMTRYYHSSVRRYRSFSANLYSFLSLLLLASTQFLINSCEEDPTTIGENILPGSDFVTILSTDTISVRSFTMYADSIKSSNPSNSYLGQLYDPYFGTTTTEFVCQMRLNSTWKEDIFIIDSVKLYLTFNNVKGNTNAGHILRLSEISEQIYTDSVYYSNKQVPLTGYSFDLQLPALQADTINDLVLDIPMESGFANYITRNTSMFFHDNSVPDFRSYFKGFYFQLIPSGDPAFVTLSVAPASTFGVYYNYIILFLHDEFDVQSEFAFIFDSYTRNASFNRYIHDYSAGEPGKRFDERINKNILDTLTYLQGLNGVYTRILLSGLDSIKNNPSLKGISVNRAKLVYPYWNDETNNNQSDLPSQLLMRYTDNTGTKYYVDDYAASSSFYDGTIDTVTGVYNFNIGTFVQRFLNDTENTFKPELELFISPGSTLDAIMRSNGNSKPVKFDFTYTKF